MKLLHFNDRRLGAVKGCGSLSDPVVRLPRGTRRLARSNPPSPCWEGCGALKRALLEPVYALWLRGSSDGGGVSRAPFLLLVKLFNFNELLFGSAVPAPSCVVQRLVLLGWLVAAVSSNPLFARCKGL